jgi:DNA-directed RNA polymerase specialized sigma24 family protein
MDLPSLRRAFRARPGTDDCVRFACFLDELPSSDAAWSSLVRLLERDVIPVVSRCHPEVEAEEISSTCLGGVFEAWIPEWRVGVRVGENVRRLVRAGRPDDAWTELEAHPRFRGGRAEEALGLWRTGAWDEAARRIEGPRSARSYFIVKTRAQVGESQRKLRRQSRLTARHCSEAFGLPLGRTAPSLVDESARINGGAELESGSGERSGWRISLIPPAHLPSQELSDRLQRMLEAIEALGPEHARVFKLLLEGLSQRDIARVEGRHPAVISRRVRNLQKLCRERLLE